MVTEIPSRITVMMTANLPSVSSGFCSPGVAILLELLLESLGISLDLKSMGNEDEDKLGIVCVGVGDGNNDGTGFNVDDSVSGINLGTCCCCVAASDGMGDCVELVVDSHVKLFLKIIDCGHAHL